MLWPAHFNLRNLQQAAFARYRRARTLGKRLGSGRGLMFAHLRAVFGHCERMDPHQTSEAYRSLSLKYEAFEICPDPELEDLVKRGHSTFTVTYCLPPPNPQQLNPKL